MTQGARHLNQVLKDIYDTAQKFQLVNILKRFLISYNLYEKRGCPVQICIANKITQEAEYNMFTLLAYKKT